MSRDLRPEQIAYRDTGCDLAPACLSCPFVVCRYDMRSGRPSRIPLTVIDEHRAGAGVERSLKLALALGTREVNIWTPLERMVCVNCGLQWAADARWVNERRESGDSFYCPNGHTLSYRETIADRLRKRLDYAERDQALTRADLAYERKQHSATKGKVTKLRKRAEAGMCSDCGRTFPNYAKHQADVHGVANGMAHKR